MHLALAWQMNAFDNNGRIVNFSAYTGPPPDPLETANIPWRTDMFTTNSS
jgi:hypothetical protein